MKSKPFILFIIAGVFLLNVQYILAQNVAINSTGTIPDASAMLDISSSNSGLLIPRIALTQTTSAAPIAAPANSLMVYNTASINDVSPGYYFWNGSQWVRFFTGSQSDDWTLFGNTGTNPTANFIGTIDARDLAFRTSNIERMRINSIGNLGVGTTTPEQRLVVEYNTSASNRIVLRNTITTGEMIYAFSSGVNQYYAGTHLRNSYQELRLYNNHLGGYLTFVNNGGQERMRITNNGYLGLGTTTPSTQLHTTAGVRFAGIGGTGNHLTIDAFGNITRTTISTAADDEDWQVVGNNVISGHGGLYPSANVGIGNTNPLLKLDVQQTTSAAAGIGNKGSIGAFNPLNPIVYEYRGFLIHTHVEVGFPNMTSLVATGSQGGNYSSLMSFYTRNYGGYPEERMRIDNVGNIGIGTTAPSTQLHTTGGVRFAGIGGAGNHLTIDALGNITRTTIATSSCLWTENGSDIYRNTGNVGIGTTIPSAKLQVTGNAYITTYLGVGIAPNTLNRIYAYHSSGNPAILGHNTFLTTAGLTGVAGTTVSAGNGYLGTYRNNIRAGVYGEEGSYTGTNYAGYFDGNLGLTSAIYLNGNPGTSGQVLTSNGAGAVFWNSIVSAPAEWTDYGDYLSPSDGGGQRIYEAGIYAGYITASDYRSYFAHRNAGTFGSSGGNNFNNYGVILESGYSESGGFQANGDNAHIWSPGDYNSFAGSSALFIVHDEDGMTNTDFGIRWYLDGVGTAYTVSDNNLKTNIKTIENGLDKVLAIRGVTYEMKYLEGEKDKGQINENQSGVIAQEVSIFMPEIVNQNSDGRLFVNYDGITPFLIEAIKEQQQIINTQEEKIDDLQKQIDELRALLLKQ